MYETSHYFTSPIISRIQELIRENDGNEIFLKGYLNEEGIVDRIELLTRGNINSTPAILHIEGPNVVVIHNHPSGNLIPSDADIGVASALGNNLVGFYIIDNDVQRVNIVVRPVKKKIRKLDPKLLLEYISPSSKKVLSSEVEEREAQKRMLEGVAEAFNSEKIALIEAGTGTGKTWAYLIPAMEWSIQNNEKIVISTYTKHLQEQIVRDFDYLNRKLKKGKMKISILQGRNNYLCLLRYERFIQKPSSLFPEGFTPDKIRILKEWVASTETGVISDLPFSIPEELWEEISASGETCLREKCPYYPDRCFYFRSKEKSLKSNIVVVNHHLTFSDYFIKKFSRENAIIPDYRRIIFDEAHHIEDAFRSQLEQSFSLLGLKRTINKLYKPQGKKNSTGLLVESSNLVPPDLTSEALLKISETLSSAEEFFNFFYNSINFKEDSFSFTTEQFPSVVKNLNRVIGMASELSTLMAKCAEKIDEIAGKVREVDPLLGVEIKARSLRLNEYASTLNDFFETEDANMLSIVEANRRKGAGGVKFKIQPVEVNNELFNYFGELSSAILTSATFSVYNSFDFFKKWNGLEEVERTIEMILPSPFDYESNMKILIPTDLPEPDEAGYSVVASDFLIEALRRSRGRSFILFTSYTMLESFYAKIYPILDQENFLLLKQGQFPRSQLLEKFKGGKKAVLFGTDSFWEGVDVAGEKLSMVVITRLPFPVPTDPLYRAKTRIIKEKGENPFFSYAVPAASLKLKQGVGRLIRTRKDRGIIIILDGRIVTRSYGRKILDTLPSSNIIKGDSLQLLTEIENFIGDAK